MAYFSFAAVRAANFFLASHRERRRKKFAIGRSGARFGRKILVSDIRDIQISLLPKSCVGARYRNEKSTVSVRRVDLLSLRTDLSSPRKKRESPRAAGGTCEIRAVVHDGARRTRARDINDQPAVNKQQRKQILSLLPSEFPSPRDVYPSRAARYLVNSVKDPLSILPRYRDAMPDRARMEI